MSYTASKVVLKKKEYGWQAYLFFDNPNVSNFLIIADGETRQEAIDNLQKEIGRLHYQWQSASHAFSRFLREEEST